MSRCLFCTIVVFLVAIIITTTHGYINNFRFKHSNVVKNNILPFKVRITGTYYIDLLGTPELSYLSSLPLKTAVVASSLEGTNLPVVCTGDTAGLIAGLDGEAHKNLAKKLTDLESLVDKAETTPQEVVSLIRGWGPYVDTSDPDYQCKKFKMTAAPDTAGAFTFTLDVLFDSYKPIVFVDAMGVGQFTYKRSYDAKHMGHLSGNPIRFCGGVDYTGDMYTFEPRPKCPMTSSKKARHYGRAIITVYKPNIVSFRWNATRCLQTLTHVHAYENLFGAERDAWRKQRVVETTEEECKEWNRTLNACNTFKLRLIREGDQGIDYKYYDSHQWECKLQPQFSQNTAIREFQSSPRLAYDYSATHIVAYEKRTATLSRGFLEISMPTGTMVSPWMNVPAETQQRGYYSSGNVTVIWQPIPPVKLCKYVPRFRGEVKYIKYKHGDYNIPIDPNAEGERYTVFLVADEYGALFNVDSAQKIADVSKFDCMPHKSDYRTSLYQAGSDQIIMVTMVDGGDPDKHDKSHIPEDVRHEGTDEQAHGAYGAISYDVHEKKVTRVQHDNVLTAPKHTTVKGDPTVTHDLKDHFHSVKAAEGGEETPATTPPPPPNIPTQMDMLNYINYQRALTQRENLHVRAMQSCFINQLDWDVYTQLLDLNPSRAISNRLNIAVEASLGGNGFYNVKRCELAVDVVVIPTLRTNSKEKVTVNGEDVTVRQIVKHMGASPDPEKCFVMPLLVFTSPVMGIQVVGQLTLDGILNTQKLAYLEACGRNKEFVFIINDYGYFFHNYMLNFTESADVVRNATDRFLRASNPTRMLSAGGGEAMTPEQIRNHTLSKIHTLSIVQPSNLKEKEYSHFPTGLFSNDMYSVAEHQSISLGLMKLMEEQNFERFATREFTADWNQDLSSTDAGLFAGMDNFMEGAGDFFLKVGQGSGALLYGLGGGVGKAAKGIGDGVGKAGKGIFDGIGDALKGTFMSLAFPLIAVAVLAIVGVIVYKQLTGKKTPPTPEEEKGQQRFLQQQPPPPPPPYPYYNHQDQQLTKRFNF